MRLYHFFKERKEAARPLVLATVFETTGSTYSKAGDFMLISNDGLFCGMLSGGCLEGDLVERARIVSETGVAQTTTYDLGADDDLWGLGVGCDGSMHILLQPLSTETGYEPFASIARIMNGGRPAVAAIAVESESPEVKIGAAAILQGNNHQDFGLGDAAARSIEDYVGEIETASTRLIETANGSCTVLISKIAPSPSLLVLGAGLDSEPLTRIAAELGWRCSVVDHRAAYIESRSYPRGADTVCCAVDEMSSRLDLAGFDMAIVMSHHLASDRGYLRQLAQSSIAYIGLLGPPGRKERLMDDLADDAEALQERLHGPAGIELGGRGPGAIALEIVAEMQQYLCERSKIRGRVDIR